MPLAPENSAEQGRGFSEKRPPGLLSVDGGGSGSGTALLLPPPSARRWGNACSSRGCAACWSSCSTATAWTGPTACPAVAMTVPAGVTSC